MLKENCRGSSCHDTCARSVTQGKVAVRHGANLDVLAVEVQAANPLLAASVFAVVHGEGWRCPGCISSSHCVQRCGVGRLLVALSLWPAVGPEGQ